MMMNRENWEKKFTGTLSYDNDANDYFFQWISLDSDEYNLVDLFKEWMGVGIFSEVKVCVKVFKGAIFFEAIKEAKP